VSDSGRGPLDFPDDEPRRSPEGLSIEEQERRWAHRRDPDLDKLPESRPARPPGSRYGWAVGVLAFIALAYITINTFRSQHISSTGLKAGLPLPAFAAPLAVSDLKGDVDVAVRRNSGAAGRVPACDLRGPDILNICELAERGPVVLAFFATRSGKCVHALDRLQALVPSFPGVQFAAIAIRGDRGAVRNLVRSHRWTFPVGFDADGTLANLYGIALCPQVTYASAGGIVEQTGIAAEDLPTMRRRVQRVVAISKARNWHPPPGA